MTRKDYIRLAEEVRIDLKRLDGGDNYEKKQELFWRRVGYLDALDVFMAAMQRDNRSFDKGRFREAVGV